MPLKNLTIGTDAEASVFFPTMSKIVMDIPNGHRLPIVLAQPTDIANAANPVEFLYLDQIEVLDTDYTTTMPAPVFGTHQGGVIVCTTGTPCNYLSIESTENLSNLAHKVSFMPNPTTGLLNVNLTALTTASTIIITDITGRMIDTRTNQFGHVTVDMTHNPAGIYFIAVQNIEGNMTAKIVVTE
jgi:hypothetical protein